MALYKMLTQKKMRSWEGSRLFVLFKAFVYTEISHKSFFSSSVKTYFPLYGACSELLSHISMLLILDGN